MTPTPTIDHRPADSRFHTDIGWLDSWHSFSFGEHYDARNTGHGLLIVSNDDRVAPAGGFGTHGHRDMEIVTWVLDGELEHRDSTGTHGVIYPGLAQRMSAGSGIRHSEMNHSSTEPVHFVQMWVVPDEYGIEPGYEQLDVNDRLAAGGLVAVASGRGHAGAVTIHQQGAVMWVGRLGDGEAVTLPDAPYVHVFAARGDVRLGDTTLREGDAARLSSAGPLELVADGDAEVIVWESAAAATR
jgi:redox-sensitive bicupin YhaK (pirin superfamily)